MRKPRKIPDSHINGKRLFNPPFSEREEEFHIRYPVKMNRDRDKVVKMVCLIRSFTLEDILPHFRKDRNGLLFLGRVE